VQDSAPPAVVRRLLDLLAHLGEEAHRPVVASMVEQSSGRMRLAALRALAHLPRTEDRPDLASLINGPDDQAAGHALHCAGLTGDPVLASTRTDPNVPEPRRFLAAWWSAEGPAIREN
jgi:hypothetical protein